MSGKTLFQVEFVTSDLVRLYIDGRDIRTDLGGIKTPSSSTTTTPRKYVDDGSKTEIETADDELTVEITGKTTNESDVKHILSNIVSDATGETKVKEDVAAVLTKIVGEVVAEKQTVLSDIVDDATSTVAKTQVKDALNEIIDQTVRTVEVKGVLNEIVEGSTNETEKQEVCAGQNDSKESVQTISDEKTENDSLNESKESNISAADAVIEKASDLSSGTDTTKPDDEKQVEQKESVQVALNESVESAKTVDISNVTDISETHETLKAVVNTLNDIIENSTAAGTIEL